MDPRSRLRASGAKAGRLTHRSLREVFAAQNLPDRARRFGPTATLSGRGGDEGLGVRGQGLGGTKCQKRKAFRVFTLIPGPQPLAPIPRIRRHRWLQANESPTLVASTSVVGIGQRQIRPGKTFRDRCDGRVRF